MADNTKIEWTDATWNPITGCTRVSSGCLHCYAERLAATRLRQHPSRRGLTDKHGRWNGVVRFNEQWLNQPLRWRKPRGVFVCAHGDLFHENVPQEWIDQVFAVMALAPQHVFQVLTKRATRMHDYMAADTAMYERVERYMERWANDDAMPLTRDTRWQIRRLTGAWQPLARWPLPNVWLGVSAEDQNTYDERVPLLLETPAAKRWLSLEPLIGPISMRFNVDWVVVGGESGPGFRPMDPSWARALLRQTRLAGVRFFMKQMAGKAPIPKDLMIREWPEVVRHG